MNKVILLFIAVAFCNCGEPNKPIDFVELKENEFNSAVFKIPGIAQEDSLKHAHDSCMGFSFEVNAILVSSNNKYFLGSVVNRQTLQVVNTLNDLGLTEDRMIRDFNIITNPCYEKRIMTMPLKTILGNDFKLQLTGVNNAINKELESMLLASENPEMKTGSWIYFDMESSLKRILDTIQTEKGMLYKKNLLDTANMVLTAAESITDVSFVISSQKQIPQLLQTVLKTRPSANDTQQHISLQLSYLNDRQILMSLNGFFPVAGQFMKAKL